LFRAGFKPFRILPPAPVCSALALYPAGKQTIPEGGKRPAEKRMRESPEERPPEEKKNPPADRGPKP